MKKCKNIALLALFFGMCAYVYAGFYFVDPDIARIHRFAGIAQKLIKLFFPAGVAGFVYLFFAFRKGKITKKSAALLIGGGISLMLLALFLAECAYLRSKRHSIGEFSATLQLTPRLLTQYQPARYNVVCLGGSTTEFSDEAGRDWPSLVEKRLKEHYGFGNVLFSNMGRQWYSTLHILTHYIQNIRPYRPQMVIVMENINDLLINADFSKFSIGPFRADYGHFLGPDIFPGLDSYERNIRTLIALAKADGTRVIVMTQPNLYKQSMSAEEKKALLMLNTEAVGHGRKWAHATALSGFTQYNDRMRQIAVSENVSLIDLEKEVPKSLAYFSDDVHYTSRAYDLIALYLAERFSQLLPDAAR
jgi:lysophospholipase L1-like esterase